MYYRDWRGWLAATFVVLVGLARVYEAMHWPSDIIGSAVLGFVAAWAAGLVLKLPIVSELFARLDRKFAPKPALAKQPAPEFTTKR